MKPKHRRSYGEQWACTIWLLLVIMVAVPAWLALLAVAMVLDLSLLRYRHNRGLSGSTCTRAIGRAGSNLVEYMESL